MEDGRNGSSGSCLASVKEKEEIYSNRPCCHLSCVECWEQVLIALGKIPTLRWAVIRDTFLCVPLQPLIKSQNFRAKQYILVWQFLKKWNIEYDLAIHFWEYTPKNWNQKLKEIFAHPCSWQHYSQQSQFKGRNNPNAHRQIRG